MAPKSKKAAGAGRRAGAKYKDDRVPGPAVATEEYAAVSLYHCSTVGAILFPVPQPLHTITPRHTCFFLCGSAVALPKRLLAFNDQLIRLKLFLPCPFFRQIFFSANHQLGGGGVRKHNCTATIIFEPHHLPPSTQEKLHLWGRGY
jgi:hypothetical protein